MQLGLLKLYIGDVNQEWEGDGDREADGKVDDDGDGGEDEDGHGDASPKCTGLPALQPPWYAQLLCSRVHLTSMRLHME